MKGAPVGWSSTAASAGFSELILIEFRYLIIIKAHSKLLLSHGGFSFFLLTFKNFSL
jgi:hypothetical protein